MLFSVIFFYDGHDITFVEMLTLDLKKSNDNLVVHGKLIIYLSTNINQPINNPGPSQVSGVSAAFANMGLNSSSLSLTAGNLPSTSSDSAPSSHATGTDVVAPAHIPMPTPNLAPPAALTPEAEHPQPQQPSPQSLSRPVSSTSAGLAPNPAPTQPAISQGTTAPTSPGTGNANMRNFNPNVDQYGALPPGWE